MDGSEQDPSAMNLVLEGLADGRLWIIEAGPVWAGHGTFKPCVVCRLRIDADHIQYDVPGPRGELPTHVHCYRIWRAESDRRRKDTQP
jgi:hypothetical protein